MVTSVVDPSGLRGAIAFGFGTQSRELLEDIGFTEQQIKDSFVVRVVVNSLAQQVGIQFDLSALGASDQFAIAIRREADSNKFFPGVNFSEAIFESANRLGKAIAKAAVKQAEEDVVDAEQDRIGELNRRLSELQMQLYHVGNQLTMPGDDPVGRIQAEIDDIRRVLGFDVDAEKAESEQRWNEARERERRYEEEQRRKKENRSWFNFFFPW